MADFKLRPDLEDVTRLSNAKDIVCIGINNDLIEIIKEEASEHQVLTFTKSDIDNIISSLKNACGVFIDFDGPSGNTKGLISTLKSNQYVPFVPFYLVGQGAFKSSSIRPMDFFAQELAILPKDTYKIAMFTYDILHPKETYMGHDNSKAKTDQEKNSLNELEKVRIINASKIVDILSKQSKEKTERISKAKDLKQQDDKTRLEKVLAYSEGLAQAEGFSKILSRAGFEINDKCTDLDETLLRLQSEKYDIFLFHFSSADKNALNILREISFMRSLAHVYTIVVVPGSDAQELFEKLAQGLMWDAIIENDHSPLKMRKKILEKYNEKNESKGIFSYIYNLRKPFRAFHPWKVKTVLSENRLNEHTKKLEENPNTKYWAKAEKIVQLMLGKKKNESIEIADSLVKDYPKLLDASILQQIALIQNRNFAEVANNLFKLREHPGLSNISAEIIAGYLFKLKEMAFFEKFLAHWYENKKINNTDQLFHMISCYYELADDNKRKLHYLHKAFEINPFRAEYILSFARHLEKEKDYKRLVELWRLSSFSPRIEQAEADVNQAKALLQLGNMARAEQLIEDILKKNPENKLALSVKGEFKKAS